MHPHFQHPSPAMKSNTYSFVTEASTRHDFRSPMGGCTKSRNLAKSIRRLLNTPSPRHLLTDAADRCSNNNNNNDKNSQDSSQSRQHQNKQDDHLVLQNEEENMYDLDAWLAKKSDKAKKAFEEKWNFSLKDDAPKDGLWKWK